MNNSYSYAVFHCCRKDAELPMPLHAVVIHANWAAGCYVFSSASDARQFIENEKAYAASCNDQLVYDSDYSFAQELPIIRAYNDPLFSPFTLLKNRQLYCSMHPERVQPYSC